MTQRDCDDCNYCELEPAEEPCKSCNATDEGFTNWKKREHPTMTNADRIRSMSDEELAQFLCDFRSCDADKHPCDGCKAERNCHTGHAGMIDWLQQPAEEAK